MADTTSITTTIVLARYKRAAIHLLGSRSSGLQSLLVATDAKSWLSNINTTFAIKGAVFAAAVQDIGIFLRAHYALRHGHGIDSLNIWRGHNDTRSHYCAC